MIVERVQLSKKQVLDVARDPSVAALTPTMPVRLIGPRDVGRAPAAATTTAWGISAVKADTSPYDGAGVSVAVLDTGIDATHAAFTGVELQQEDFTRTGNGDNHGHGTHCAGTIFGRDVNGVRIGVARGVTRAMIGKVLAGDGTGRSDWLQDAILWAGRAGARVISMSIGLDFPGAVAEMHATGMPIEAATSVALESYRANVRAFDSLLALLRARASFEHGSLVIVAAGNESNRNFELPDAGYRVAASLPAAAAGAISVGALAQSAHGLSIARFSNAFPQVCAPGVSVVSARRGGGLIDMTGTSMAAPHVAGVAALWWQHAGVAAREPMVTTRLLFSTQKEGFATPPDESDVGGGVVTAPQ